MDLSRFPRRRYTPFVTPLEPLPHFSAALAATCPDGQGPEVWIKRDDMLGLFPGGNKTRKLEFLVADALAQGADTLITCGAPQSNHCRITLAAAVKEGLKCRFVIEERVPGSFHEDASGNHFMFRLFGVEAITVVPVGSNMAAAMQLVADELASQGRKGYIIAGGGSNAIGGLGYVAKAVCEALIAAGREVSYTIQEISPQLAEAQRARTAGLPVTVQLGDVLAAEHPADGYDLILSNEMVGDLPAVQLHRTDVGLTADGGEVDPALLAGLGRPGELVRDLGISLDDAPDPFYLLTGALELMIRIGRWLAPEGVAIVTEFGERHMWPKLSSHLDHPELSTHFGHLQTAAITLGLTAKIEFVMDLIDLDRTLDGLATTRSHFRALVALFADAGVALPKVGYTRELLAATAFGKLDLADVGELRWDRIEDRLMGLVPHEFKALVCQKPGGN